MKIQGNISVIGFEIEWDGHVRRPPTFRLDLLVDEKQVKIEGAWHDECPTIETLKHHYETGEPLTELTL